MQRAAAVFAKSINDQVDGTLDYSEESIPRLDDVIDQAWPKGPGEDTVRYTLPPIAAYVGEVVIRNIGGRWVIEDHYGVPAIEFRDQVAIPINRVGKRLMEGREWNLTTFYGELAAVWKEGRTDRMQHWTPKEPPTP